MTRRARKGRPANSRKALHTALDRVPLHCSVADEPRSRHSSSGELYAISKGLLPALVLLRVLAPQIDVVKIFSDGRPSSDPVPSDLSGLEPPTLSKPAQVPSTEATPDGRLLERE